MSTEENGLLDDRECAVAIRLDGDILRASIYPTRVEGHPPRVVSEGEIKTCSWPRYRPDYSGSSAVMDRRAASSTTGAWSRAPPY